MSKRLLISYDLVDPGQNYDDVYDYMQKFIKARSPLESVWVVKTNKTINKVRDELKGIVDKNDKILVVNITDRGAAWNNIDSDDWIKNDEI